MVACQERCQVPHVVWFVPRYVGCKHQGISKLVTACSINEGIDDLVGGSSVQLVKGWNLCVHRNCIEHQIRVPVPLCVVGHELLFEVCNR